MIIKTIQEDIFDSKSKHIAFAINTEGYNDSGFAGQVSHKYWNELAICGEHKIGTVLSKTVGEKTFHALVCHSLHDGWGKNQADVIKKCFDKIPANGEPIATIAIGTGFIGMISGANFRQIICGMHDSKQKIMLHAGYTLDAVIDCYNEEKQKQNLEKEKKLLLELHKKGLL
ncbi:MAG TPA: hypothetical protein IAC20_00560 [Candidatus Faecisoma merdavium]|nr:hypothetical protein [Candidatus Faecisoma merdavium]